MFFHRPPNVSGILSVRKLWVFGFHRQRLPDGIKAGLRPSRCNSWAARGAWKAQSRTEGGGFALEEGPGGFIHLSPRAAPVKGYTTHDASPSPLFINPTLLVTPLLLNRALMRLCWYCSSQRLWKTRHPENVRSHGFVFLKTFSLFNRKTLI